MSYYLLLSIPIILVSFIVGVLILKKFDIKGIKSALPIGYLCLVGILQIFYYPIQYLELPMKYIAVVSILIMGIILVVGILNYNHIFIYLKKYIKSPWKILAILTFMAVFLYISKQTPVNYRTDDILYYEPLIQGKTTLTNLAGQDIATYAYAGYYDFFACILYLGQFLLSKINIITENLFLGNVLWVTTLVFYLSVPLIIFDLAEDFNLNKGVKVIIAVVLGALFIVDNGFLVASYLGIIQSKLYLILAILLFMSWDKNKSNSYAILISLSIFSLIAFASSNLFITCILFYAFFIYVIKNEENYILPLCIIFLPMAIYVSISYPSLIFICIGIYLVALLIILLKQQNQFEKILKKSSHAIFMMVPVLFTLLPFQSFYESIALNLKFGADRAMTSDFFYYAGNDMVPDLVGFLNGDLFINLRNILYWGLIIFYLFCNKRKSKYEVILILCTIITFFNPFVYRFVYDNMTAVVYFRIANILFNLVVIVILIQFIAQIEPKKLKIGLSGIMCIMLILTYTHDAKNILLEKPEQYNRLYRTSNIEIDYLKNLKINHFNNLEEKKPYYKIASHIYGVQLLTDLPVSDVLGRGIQFGNSTEGTNFDTVFTRRQPGTRDYDVDYTQACRLAKEKELDYVIIDAQYNWKLEEGLWPCIEKVYEEGNYRTFKMRYDLWEWNIKQGYVEDTRNETVD